MEACIAGLHFDIFLIGLLVSKMSLLYCELNMKVLDLFYASKLDHQGSNDFEVVPRLGDFQ